MSLISDFLGRLASLLLRLALALAGALFALSLLVAGVIVMLFLLLRALLTGRKPAAMAAWQHYRQAARQAQSFRSRFAVRPGRPGAHGAKADVVDVQARDLPRD